MKKLFRTADPLYERPARDPMTDTRIVTPVEIERLEHANGLDLPAYETELSAGADLRAAVHEDVCIDKGERALIPTGLKMKLPEGFEAQIRPRSGLAYKHGLTVLNSPGTIDADYRGEVKVLLINHGDESLIVRRGLRIAQLVLKRAQRAEFTEVDALSEDTARGDGGFGSTGVD